MLSEDFKRGCDLLPEGVCWGENLTPELALHIADAALRAQADAGAVAWMWRDGGAWELSFVPDDGSKPAGATECRALGYTHPSLPAAQGLSRMQQVAMADAIIADYKEHYDFPTQGESHMHDCIVSALAGAATVAEPSDEAASYKRMFEDAVRSLAAIDEALGIDPDEAGGAEPILQAIEELKAAQQQAEPVGGEEIVRAAFRKADAHAPMRDKTPRQIWRDAYAAAHAGQQAMWTDEQMERFAWSCINPSLGADSIGNRLAKFRGLEELRGNVDQSGQRAGVADTWERFAGWLVDHCEGNVITEEFLKAEFAKMLDADALAAAPTQQQERSE